MVWKFFKQCETFHVCTHSFTKIVCWVITKGFCFSWDSYLLKTKMQNINAMVVLIIIQKPLNCRCHRKNIFRTYLIFLSFETGICTSWGKTLFIRKNIIFQLSQFCRRWISQWREREAVVFREGGPELGKSQGSAKRCPKPASGPRVDEETHLWWAGVRAATTSPLAHQESQRIASDL